VLARIRQGVRVDHFETLRQRKDGTLIPISLTISPIRDDAGRIVGASKIARDISERQLQNERTAFLAEAGRRWRRRSTMDDAEDRRDAVGADHRRLVRD
jgi:hypothetical protein